MIINGENFEVNSEFYGQVVYDEDGKPICAICEKMGIRTKGYKKLLNHVSQIHGISARQYKELCGLDITKGILCEETKEKLRNAVKKNYDILVKENLLNKGENTRFKLGNAGRGEDKVSEQSRRRLVDNLYGK